jgi:hypothetical protein
MTAEYEEEMLATTHNVMWSMSTAHFHLMALRERRKWAPKI